MRYRRALGVAFAAVAVLGPAAPAAAAGTSSGPGGFHGSGNGTGQYGSFGNGVAGKTFGSVGDGNLRNIVATPGVIIPGSRLTVAANGCRAGTMSSSVFNAVPLTPLSNDTVRGVVLIDRAARPGRYDVTVRCGGRTLTRPAAFTVLGGVRGGVGGSRAGGATTADMAIGGALVAASVIGGGVHALRRRKERF